MNSVRVAGLFLCVLLLGPSSALGDVISLNDPCAGIWCQAKANAMAAQGCNGLGSFGQSNWSGCSGSCYANTNQTADPYTWTAAETVIAPYTCTIADLTGPDVLRTFAWLDVCAAKLNVTLNGVVDRACEPSATCIPPQEVCNTGCMYGLSSAVAGTGIDGSLLWSGTWRGTGVSCPGSNPPGPASEGEGSGESASVGDAGAVSDDALAANDLLFEQWKTDSIASRTTPSGSSPIGVFFQLPSAVTDLFTRTQTNCQLGINLSGTVLSFMSGQISGADVCAVQTFADSYGNWFTWFCALVWSWAIVTRGHTIA